LFDIIYKEQGQRNGAVQCKVLILPSMLHEIALYIPVCEVSECVFSNVPCQGIKYCARVAHLKGVLWKP